MAEEIKLKDVTIEQICSICSLNFPGINIKKIQEAYDLANKGHGGQYRLSGEKYISHPLFVAYIVARIKLDEESIIAALLHDILEDTKTPISEIEEKFGEEVTFLVKGLTDVKKVTKNIKPEDNDFENIRKLLITSTKDVRIILIKLADRLHNIMTIDYLPEERRKRNAKETLKFYAPLADFVGMNYFRKLLEDYAFKTLEPDTYELIESYISKQKFVNIPIDEYIGIKISQIQELLLKNKIKFKITGRSKSIYSTYKKVLKKNDNKFDVNNIGKINDIIGLTVFTHSILECYKILGVLSSSYKQEYNLLKDYIAHPKLSGYRAIHIHIIDENNIPVEIQIKTFQMNEYNEFGPASHIYYKQSDGKKFGNNQEKELKSLVAWKDENREEYTVNIFKDNVFVFTPKGDVKELKKGACIIDFAYLVHTDVGNSAVGAKVNGIMKPLHTILNTSDVIEIITDKKRKSASKDWLRFACTPHARANIRRSLKET